MKSQTGYRIVGRKTALDGKPDGGLDRRELAEALGRDGQFLVPILELVQNAQGVVDEVIDVMGEIGREMDVRYRETAGGGLAATPTGRKLAKERLYQIRRS